jgi:valyl-tRNA synthetase
MSTATLEDLPKQYHHAAPEERWYRYWEDRGYFQSDPDPARKPYTIVIPPPNVTGALHLGHALNNSLQDILIRFKRMQGYNALWMPGTDHAGIATQAVVERRILAEEKQTRHQIGREKLVERIWVWKHEYERRILGQLKRLGCSCDWRRTRFTLDDICARAVRHTFFSLFKAGLIYRGKRLVNWDTTLQTAVSDDEVTHETVQGHFWHMQYPVIDPRPGEPTHVAIATTRPETMLGDTAVAVHPDPAAALAKAAGELEAKLAAAGDKQRPEIEAQLAELARRREEVLPGLVQLRDMARAGRKLMLPLLNRVIPLVCDTWAKPELGSGCVKITPAHDPNDYDVWQRNPAIGAINILNPDGTLNDAAGPYKGLKVLDARKRVVADMEAAGLLVEVEDREIELAHSDRSMTPIEPYLADQWFVKMSDHADGRPGLAQMSMDAVILGRVKIVPERYGKTYLDWLGEKRDWCIGRQLWWGHRVPVWRKTSSNAQAQPIFEALPHHDSIDIELLNQQVKPGLENVLSSQVRKGPGENEVTLLTCIAPGHEEWEEKLNQEGMEQDTDVLDTWFSSALWPHSTLGWPGPALADQPPGPANPDWNDQRSYYPTSVLVTNRDIITLWVARMVLTGLHNVGEIPFHEVYIHPKILDGYGEGMSKSKGNGVDPIDVIDKFGADALRFGLAFLTTETQDIRMPVEFECPHCAKSIEQTKKNRVLPKIACPHCGGEFSTQWADKPEDKALPRGAVVSERFEISRNFCNKLWNAARFTLLNLDRYTPAAVLDADLAVEDRWILSRLATVTASVTAALDGYRFADATRLLYEFAWDEFCSFYVEMIKGRLQDPAARPVAQRVLAHTLDTLLRLLHPLTPFITEEIWQLLSRAAPARGLSAPATAAESIMIADWPEAQPRRQDAEIEARFVRFQELLKGLREIRSRQNLPPKTAIEFSLRCDEATAALLQPMATYIESMAKARGVAWGPRVLSPRTAASVGLACGELHVDLTGLIDVPAEIARNEKERERLQAAIASKDKKLANANFVDRAPAEVVAAERASLAEARERLAAVEAALMTLRST